MKKNSEQLKIELLERYAACFNYLDVSKIEDFIDENVEYYSMWVLSSIVGKKIFLGYLIGKINTLIREKASTSLEAKLFLGQNIRVSY